MLQIQFKDGQSPAVELTPPGKTIGKGAINDVVIDKAGVAGFHADLKVEGDQVLLSDVDTDTGTYLNGDLISGPTSLRVGDVVMIQGVELLVCEQESNHAKTLVLSGNAMVRVSNKDWCLVAGTGPERGQHIPITERMEIGRALECDISILEPALSRKHAEIEPVDGKLLLRDLGSANGTFVNGKKIDAIQLSHKDVLQFHKIRFLVKAPR